ncbi:hypothetical protein BV25DRAFT_1833520 [Artomyces pyxidatus]|uniref:Uncharacterized protein n=1 Tax=Artomyces pyxidatus TaxID=48021 RepID=A0ACB8SE85_9AGAM|nr:hypothetical protein BV25DRAFT_1833520 [Artomyces pyxidatus]
MQATETSPLETWLLACDGAGGGLQTHTLTRHFLFERFHLGAKATEDFALLLAAIQPTSKSIATNVYTARLIDLRCGVFLDYDRVAIAC